MHNAYLGRMTNRVSPLRSGLAFLVAGTVGCGFPKSGPVPGAVSPDMVAVAKAKHPDANEAQLTEGRQIFEKRCNKCHGHPDVTYKSADEWPAVIKRMASKADLDPKQQESVLQFVLAAREVTLGPSPAAAAGAAPTTASTAPAK